MKRYYFVLILCLVSIISVLTVFCSCGGSGETNSSDTQNVNVQVSEGNAEWVEIATFGQNDYYSENASTGMLFDYTGHKTIVARQVGGKTYYKIKEDGSAVSENPHYGEDSERGAYKYIIGNGPIYINF